MIAVILIYLLIGWIVGFILATYYFFDSVLAYIQAILFWPLLLVLAVYHLMLTIKKLKYRSK